MQSGPIIMCVEAVKITSGLITKNVRFTIIVIGAILGLL